MKSIIRALPLIILALTKANTVKAQRVILDYYFNHEYHLDNGISKRYHYLWDDKSPNGLSGWGDLFRKYKAATDTLGQPPTAENLKNAGIYIIVDPDNKKDNPSPNYISGSHAEVIAGWVKRGGVLVMLANDSSNTDLSHFNILAEKFKFHFNTDLENHVVDDAHFEDGAVTPLNRAIFPATQKAFLKDVCSLTGDENLTPVFISNKGAIIAAVISFGRGKVFAAGDPWLYNEYMNGRLPTGFDNDTAAEELTRWLLLQAAILAKKP